ncbi:iron ABC transporter permease [Paenibacillus qinlingensis]|uniref:Iron complex transport system permease protein n=1 Tax=Paenibacillus qinlingensis TaxID=1837343 RepID=A0ABU1P638_9BACL|nr:iron ABC transporter permease [Paenibacillus qinlingensis]MDR6555223.1 iron complex transport system permease protein [Paenibacillus qinlingensis]
MTTLKQESMKKPRLSKAITVMSILTVLIIIVFIISMNTGVIRLSPLEVLRTLFGGGTAKQGLILFDFRLPRIVISILVGAGLAVSGAILQGISRNMLADPGILGINAGAGLAIILVVSFYKNNAASPLFFMPMIAMLGAGLAALLIYTLSYVKGKGISSSRLLLVGIAVSAGIAALMMVLSIRLDPTDFQFVQVWLAGSIWGTNWKFVLALLPWIVILIPYVMFKANVLNVLNLGEMTSIGLGIRMERERLGLLAAAVALAGACVAVGGGIGFVGLIGPHLARRLVGPRHQYLLPASALTGGLILIVADTLARGMFQPTEVPTGIVAAVIGAPYFLYLLVRTRTS